MTPNTPTRHRLALLNGDIVDYSRLMAGDEFGTMLVVAKLRESIAMIVVNNHGRLVDFTGDNFLAEFSVAAQALGCAVEIQREIEKFNEGRPADRQMRFRLGAHSGDVLIDGERIFGSAVNTAARLEGLADAGGICMSKLMYDEVSVQLDFEVEDLGAQALKGIPEPVHALRIPPARSCAQPRNERSGRDIDDMAYPRIPCIAVLPFGAAGNDKDLEQLADAMTVDIINSLSCDRRFAVIAYNSVIQFKNEPPDVHIVGQRLDARYVVEGMVRNLAGRLRISWALIDVDTRRDLASDHFDCEADRIFDAFDEAIETIVTALASHLKLTEGQRFRRRPPEQLDAWTLTIQASEIYFLNPTMTLDDSFAAVRRALEIDPGYAYAWAVLGFLYAFKYPLGLSTDRDADVSESLRLTDKALAMDARDPWHLTARSIALQYAGRPGESMEYLMRSLRLNPSDVLTHCYYGRGLMFSGTPDIAVAHFERFKRLNPNDPGSHMADMYHAIALAYLGRWQACEAAARRSLAASGGRNPWSLAFLMLALGGQRRQAEIERVRADLAHVAPHWDPAFVRGFFDDCQEDTDLNLPLFEILATVWPDT